MRRRAPADRMRFCRGYGIALLVLPVLLSGAAGIAAGVDVAAAIRRAGADADHARQELEQTYDRIRNEKKQAVEKNEALRKEVRELEEKCEQAATDQENFAAAVTAARRELERLEQIETQIRTVVLEYRQAFETRLSPSEAERLAPALAALDARLQEKKTEVPAAALGELIAFSAEHVTRGLGGARNPGTAVDVEGVRHEGEFICVGPLSWFRSRDGALTGVAVQQVGSLAPTVFQRLEAKRRAGIEALFATGRGMVPVDVTLGSAVRLQQAEETWTEHLRKGGVVMIPLLGLALACVLIAGFKAVVILRLATGRSQETVLRIVAALRAANPDEALRLAQSLRRPLGPVIREGIEHRETSKEHLEEILYEQILSQAPALERFLSALAVCASAAPLLGLLGTVTGMIHTFRLITVFGTGDARLLSAGISEALITTEVGLAIAIPALLAHAFLSRRVRRALSLARETAVTFVNGLKLKGDNDA